MSLLAGLVERMHGIAHITTPLSTSKSQSSSSVCSRHCQSLVKATCSSHVAPCFFSAGIYYLLGQLIQRLGPQYSPISAWLYLIIFASFDLLSIIIQAVGGASASKAGSKTPPGDTSKGTNGISCKSFCSFID